MDFRRYVAQIFGDERQLAERTSQRLEQVVVGALDPMTVDRRRLVGGNFPVGFKATKVIQTNDVTSVDRPAHSFDPPAIAVRPQSGPVIKRIAPSLSGFTKSVGRNAGDYLRGQIFLQTEHLGMGPNVRAVVADEDRDITDDSDPAFSAIGSAAHATVQRTRTAESVPHPGAFGTRNSISRLRQDFA